MFNVIRAFLVLLALTTSQRAMATPPTPPATVSLAEEGLKGFLQGPRDNLTVTPVVTAHGPVERIKLSVKLRPAVNPLLQKGEEGRPIELDVELAPNAQKKLPVKLSVPGRGRYELEIFLQGTSKTGGFSDRLIRHIVVDAKGNFRVQTFAEIEKERLSTRLSKLNAEDQKNSTAPDIGLAFGESRPVPAEIAQQVKPWDSPKAEQLQARPAKLPENLLPFIVDGTNKPAPSGDPITVKGRVIFPDYDGNPRPLVNASVWVWDQTSNELLATTVTDSNGDWSVSVCTKTGFPESRTIVHAYGLVNESLRTRGCSPTGTYMWRPEARYNCRDGEIVNFGTQTPESSFESAQVWSTLNRAWSHALSVGRRNPGFVDSCYPAKQTFFQDVLNVLTEDNDAPDTITHEYGHAVMQRAYEAGGRRNPSHGGKHEFWRCTLDKSLAWSEGWATAFMLSVRPDGVYDWHEKPGLIQEPIEKFAASNCETGHQSEGRIAAALNDMLDPADDNNGGNTEQGRNGHIDSNGSALTALGTMLHDTLWGNHHADILEFWSSLRCELDSLRQTKDREIMIYNYVPETSASGCPVTDVFALRASERDVMRRGIRQIRQWIRFVDRDGAALLDLIDRNAAEIAKILLGRPRESATALDVVKYLAGLGDAAAVHEERLRILRKPVVAPSIRPSIEKLLALLEQKGSTELQRDLREIRVAYARVKDRSLEDLERGAAGVSDAEGRPEGAPSTHSALSPVTRTTQASPGL